MSLTIINLHEIQWIMIFVEVLKTLWTVDIAHHRFHVVRR
jgi:hypothetical protein